MYPVNVVAALSTYVYFKSYEPTTRLSLVSLLFSFPLAVFHVSHAGFTLDTKHISTSLLLRHFGIFYAIILSSIVTYRLSPFHPLAKYPGPVLCKLSKWWMMWRTSFGDTHLYYRWMHNKYGPIVRVGPNELSIAEKDLIPSILGAKGMPRGPIWDVRRYLTAFKEVPYFAVIDVRDTKIHSQLRKPWNEAFGSGPMKDYNQYLLNRLEELSGHLEQLHEEAKSNGREAVVDITKWINFFAFDFMGDLAYGGGFELMKTRDSEGAWHHMETAVKISTLVHHISYGGKLLNALPLDLKSRRKVFVNLSRRQAERRLATEAKHKDVFYHMYEAKLDPSDSKSSEEMAKTAIRDSNLIVIAGTDTSSFTICCTLCYLLCHPDVLAHVVDELEAEFQEVDANNKRVITVEKLGSMKWLNGSINEALRLLPPLPTDIQRAPGKDENGRMLGNNIFIPQGTAVNVPTYVIHRDPRYFRPEPDSFIPERWFTRDDPDAQSRFKGDFTTERDAFIPFSFGPANCVGRPIALNEVRSVIATLLLRFNFSFPKPGQGEMLSLEQQEKKWEDGVKSSFIFTKGPLEVSFSPRCSA